MKDRNPDGLTLAEKVLGIYFHSVVVGHCPPEPAEIASRAGASEKYARKVLKPLEGMRKSLTLGGR
jgi:hypothetical protein